MQINVKKKSDAIVEFSVSLKWADLEEKYISELNKKINQMPYKV